MSRSHNEQAIALAGVFQAAALVDQIAKRGLIPQNSFEASINSIFIDSPKVTEDVYGGVREIPFSLNMGLKQLVDLADKREQSKDVTRYALSMLHLESRLGKNPEMLNKISTGLDRIREQARYFEQSNDPRGDTPDSEDSGDSRYCHANVIAAIAALYQETISTFSFRIQVTGEPRHLQNSDNANKVRALLMAGIRAAILWKQVGGRRWQLLLFRSRVGKTAHHILNTSP